MSTTNQGPRHQTAKTRRPASPTGSGPSACFFCLLSGLQIFNAHPALYLGDQSGFTYDNAILELEGFPSWATIPSTQDLATGRVVHFFFAWIFVTTLLVWLVASLRNRHLRKDLLPTAKDAQNFVSDIKDHLKLKLDPHRALLAFAKTGLWRCVVCTFPAHHHHRALHVSGHERGSALAA